MGPADRPIRRDENEKQAVPPGAAFCLFATDIGTCGIAWRGRHIIRILLPEPSEAQLREHMPLLVPQATESEPSPEAAEAIARIRALLRGEPVRFSDLALDCGDAPQFERRVWEATASIPPGETRSYGEIAAAIGRAGAARAVGRALGRNPLPIIIPCHRVLASGGRSGGFSAPGGASTKMRLLDIENARRGSQPLLFDSLAWALK